MEAINLKPLEKSKGKKFTGERKILVEQVFSSHEHFDAESLVAKLERRTDGSAVSRSTIYRTLKQLVEAGLLRKMTLGNRDVYEHDYGYPQHDHLICGECGSLTEFPATEISKVVSAVSATHGFRQSGHRLEVYGPCDECCRGSRGRHPKLDML